MARSHILRHDLTFIFIDIKMNKNNKDKIYIKLDHKLHPAKFCIGFIN
jgi:hypothetical protein